MNDDFIKSLIAQRIGGENIVNDTSEYKFTKISRLKNIAMKRNPEREIIDMGVGEPDSMADDMVIEELYKQAKKWENRGYSDNGMQVFNTAAVKYMKDVYKVKDLDDKEEVNHVIGSKSALAMIAQVFIDKDDVMLMTTPGYFVTATATEWLNGKVYELPLLRENKFLPDLDNIPAKILKKAKVLYINYPNNPTGGVATKAFFEKVVKFAKENEIAVIHDAAYSALVYDNQKPLSFLSVKGAKDVGVEVHSMSKAFNMTGWRMGFVAGNRHIVKAIKVVKDNMDSGQFKPIQYASIYAMEHPEITEKTAEKYSRRLNLMTETFNKLGFKVTKSKGSFYLYIEVPTAIKNYRDFYSASEFVEYLIKEKGIVAVPWDDVGHYMRLSATFLAYGPEEEVRILNEVYERLANVEFEF